MSHLPKNTCDAETLVKMVRGGDQGALEGLTRCYGERLVTVGRSYCRNREDADDAVQDALLAAGENMGHFRGDGSLEGWLVRMVVNACHRMRRGQKNSSALHTTDEEIAGDEDPEALAARGQMIAKLGDALLTLSAEDRALVLLSEAEEWTAPEIAEALDLKPGAVRSRLMRARKKLRDALGVVVPD
ncbi:MAG: sigma-70 family RNA polymerase sigma factor [Deltaproteobacteria bacterium]|nr:sigma-70 family RNA polymerase sigma factor [Deltaproteobacteria bacterium]